MISFPQAFSLSLMLINYYKAQLIWNDLYFTNCLYFCSNFNKSYLKKGAWIRSKKLSKTIKIMQNHNFERGCLFIKSTVTCKTPAPKTMIIQYFPKIPNPRAPNDCNIEKNEFDSIIEWNNAAKRAKDWLLSRRSIKCQH